jgi:hypothetical protein
MSYRGVQAGEVTKRIAYAKLPPCPTCQGGLQRQRRIVYWKYRLKELSQIMREVEVILPFGLQNLGISESLVKRHVCADQQSDQVRLAVPFHTHRLSYGSLFEPKFPKVALRQLQV